MASFQNKPYSPHSSPKPFSLHDICDQSIGYHWLLLVLEFFYRFHPAPSAVFTAWDFSSVFSIILLACYQLFQMEMYQMRLSVLIQYSMKNESSSNHGVLPLISFLMPLYCPIFTLVSFAFKSTILSSNFLIPNQLKAVAFLFIIKYTSRNCTKLTTMKIIPKTTHAQKQNLTALHNS